MVCWSASTTVFSQNIDETVYGCDACVNTPDEVSRYIQFVRSILDTMQSTTKVNFSTLDPTVKQWQINTLTDYLKQENDSYLWVFNREWRIIWTDIEWAWRELTQAISRDFLADFARQTVVWLRSSALVRDEEKIEQLDEAIDREAIVHISNFVFRDKIPSDQIAKLQSVFSAYPDIFELTPWSQAFATDLSYRDMVGWLNYMQRRVKNHIVLRPKSDFKYESSAKVSYDIKKTWTDNLQESYSCVIAVVGVNCNPTYGKTAWLRDEFGKSVGKDLKTTIGKFKSSAKKLSSLFAKNKNSGGYFDNYFSNAIQYNGPSWKRSGVAVNAAKQAKAEKQQIEEALSECFKLASENPWRYTTQRIVSLFHPEGKVVSCREKAPYEYADPGAVLEVEKTRISTLQTSMHNLITLILDMRDTNKAMAALSVPLDVTQEFPTLSKSIYSTKKTVQALNDNSIESCLAFCSNLNGQVNCGTK